MKGSVKTIQELEAALVYFESLREEHTQVPVTLLEKPLLHVYIVYCEVRYDLFYDIHYDSLILRRTTM